MLKVLVVGGGGREHALVWKLAQSPQVSRIYVAPGNAGTLQRAENIPIAASDVDGLAAFAAENGIDLTVVGPEVPLIAGIVDVFERQGLRIFGPAREPAMMTPLPAARPSALITKGNEKNFMLQSASSNEEHWTERAVGMPARRKKSLANILLPSRRAAA